MNDEAHKEILQPDPGLFTTTLAVGREITHDYDKNRGESRETQFTRSSGGLLHTTQACRIDNLLHSNRP